ncbi:threonine/serine ThrE exporter family protein [Ruania zhangjianzhongii]|uniref:threonine/serine ThrE exporter family protein n=1 Tax=Ruania zhangjianzhongii TaxID=2603206 RepID=UPI001F3FFDC2|nr:threonine/serine exporter family protein [Ruania zhangjianzhongii]
MTQDFSSDEAGAAEQAAVPEEAEALPANSADGAGQDTASHARPSPAGLFKSMRLRAGAIMRAVREPTQQIVVTDREEEISQRHARAVIDLCLRAGEAMLAAGASAADVVATTLRISECYGVTGTQVDITFTSITISVRRGLDEDPISVLRVIKNRTTDYSRLQGVYLLMAEITDADEPMDVTEALRRLREIVTQRHPYRRWVVTLGKAVLAGGVVVMYDASPVLILVAAAAAVAVDLITRLMERWGIAAFFTQIGAAAITTSIAAFMYWLQSLGIELPGANRPTVIVISGIIMLLSGIGLTSAARDAIDGYYVTASARAMEVVMLTLGLAVGISTTLGIALRLGVPMYVGTSLGPDGGLLAGTAGSALIGLGFALTSYIRLRVVPLLPLVAGIVFAVYYLLLPLTNQPGLVPGLAGVVAGVLGHLTYRWFKVPEAAMTMAGVIGLIPGLAVYRALYSLMGTEHAVSQALPALVLAFATGFGLAAGSTIGGYLARRLFGEDAASEKASRRTQEAD